MIAELKGDGMNLWRLEKVGTSSKPNKKGWKSFYTKLLVDMVDNATT